MVPPADRRPLGSGALTVEDALTVAARFGVDVTSARAAALEGGFSNQSVRIDAREGSYVVRRYGRLHVTRAAIRFEHAIQAHAAKRMPEVVAPLHDTTGATIGTWRDEGFVAVFPFVAGTSGRRDLPSACAAARVLARFHRAMRDVHLTSGMRSVRFLGVLPWLRERFTRFAADRLLARKIDWDALLGAITAATAAVAPRVAVLPHVVVHGDPNPDNVVTAEPGDVRGLIDFDFAHETERVADLGTLLDEFGRAGEDQPLEPARLAALIEAYAQEAPISADERALVPEAMLRRAATLVWYVVTRHGERAPGDVGGAPRYAARVAEIVRRSAEIRAAARG
ncbi:MAG TPA: phosphotransferase [Candidatus Acidoferrum sp.]|nr:phosphotransferase [Candidatus Acidoferrum sp.]